MMANELAATTLPASLCSADGRSDWSGATEKDNAGLPDLDPAIEGKQRPAEHASRQIHGAKTMLCGWVARYSISLTPSWKSLHLCISGSGPLLVAQFEGSIRENGAGSRLSGLSSIKRLAGSGAAAKG